MQKRKQKHTEKREQRRSAAPHAFPEVIWILFDFDRFTHIVAGVYSEKESPYSLDDVLGVFSCFFQAFELATDTIHPGIKRQQIADIIDAMPQIWVDKGGENEMLIDLEPEYYPDMITRYFDTYFPHCNYRINHFFSGHIREHRYQELFC